MYVDAWVPEQQVPPIVDNFAKDKGVKTYFLIGSDYAFGRGMLGFTRKYVEKTGGKIVGEEYLPMDGADWTPILSKLKDAKPDAIITSTAGDAPNVTLTKQMRAAGTDKLAGVLSRLEQRRCRLEQPRDPRSMGLFRRLVREALPKIAVENGGPNLKQKMSAPL